MMQAQSVRVGQGNFLRVATKCFPQPSKIRRISDDNKGQITLRDAVVKINIKMPEEPTTCCMSGCANCVWIEYAEELSKVLGSAGPHKAKEIILERVSDPNVRAYLMMELNILKNHQPTNHHNPKT